MLGNAGHRVARSWHAAMVSGAGSMRRRARASLFGSQGDGKNANPQQYDGAYDNITLNRRISLSYAINSNS